MDIDTERLATALDLAVVLSISARELAPFNQTYGNATRAQEAAAKEAVERAATEASRREEAEAERVRREDDLARARLLRLQREQEQREVERRGGALRAVAAIEGAMCPMLPSIQTRLFLLNSSALVYAPVAQHTWMERPVYSNACAQPSSHAPLAAANGDPYRVLAAAGDLPPCSDVVSAQHTVLCKLLEPPHQPPLPEASEPLAAVKEAFRILGHRDLKRAHDAAVEAKAKSEARHDLIRLAAARREEDARAAAQRELERRMRQDDEKRRQDEEKRRQDEEKRRQDDEKRRQGEAKRRQEEAKAAREAGSASGSAAAMSSVVAAGCPQNMEAVLSPEFIPDQQVERSATSSTASSLMRGAERVKGAKPSGSADDDAVSVVAPAEKQSGQEGTAEAEKAALAAEEAVEEAAEAEVAAEQEKLSELRRRLAERRTTREAEAARKKQLEASGGRAGMVLAGGDPKQRSGGRSAGSLSRDATLPSPSELALGLSTRSQMS